MGEVIISLKTGLNPRNYFVLNTEDAKNYYITIREMVGGKLMITEKTDKINDEALKKCNNRSNLEVWDVLFSWTWTIWEILTIKNPPHNRNIKEWVYSIKPNPMYLNSDFLRYLLQTGKIKNTYLSKITGWTVKSLPMVELKNIKIPIPSLATQQKIVTLLDKFDALVNDLTTGLPAELESRKKQYEHYRNQLLTFTPLKE